MGPVLGTAFTANGRRPVLVLIAPWASPPAGMVTLVVRAPLLLARAVTDAEPRVIRTRCRFGSLLARIRIGVPGSAFGGAKRRSAPPVPATSPLGAAPTLYVSAVGLPR